MLEEMCRECRNWFTPKGGKHCGTFTIKDGIISPLDFVYDNQYFRIVGSCFNDGVHQNTSSVLASLTDEVFDGQIWVMKAEYDNRSVELPKIEKSETKAEPSDETAIKPCNCENTVSRENEINTGNAVNEAGILSAASKYGLDDRYASIDPDAINNRSDYENMSIEELQVAILEKMAKNGPVNEQMIKTVMDNVYHDSLCNWVKSFR